jgi:hypothetical protein
VGRKFERVVEYPLLNLRSHSIADAWSSSGFLKKPLQSILFNGLLDVVIVLAADTQLPTGIADVPKGLAKLKNIELASNDILSLSDGSSSYG